MEEKSGFDFTYSAPDQNEIKKIREKYLPREISTLERLRALDSSATRRGNALAIAHGCIHSLILGFGMSCCLVWAGNLFVPGILVGCLGIAGVSVTYPIYTRILRREREKIAPEILRLSDELILENNSSN